MRDTPKSTGKKDKPMTSVLLPEGELRVARCDMLDKLIAVGDGERRCCIFISCGTAARTAPLQRAPCV